MERTSKIDVTPIHDELQEQRETMNKPHILTTDKSMVIGIKIPVTTINEGANSAPGDLEHGNDKSMKVL